MVTKELDGNKLDELNLDRASTLRWVSAEVVQKQAAKELARPETNSRLAS
jgi:hypothetical protein